MQVIDRRALFRGTAAGAASLLAARLSHATLVRGLTLPRLVAGSRHVVLLRPLESYSHYVVLGGRRSIVTDTRVRIEDVVAKQEPEGTELIVRTLGGRIDRVGEIVHGQAELELEALSLAFLKRGSDEAHWVVGMAQGHYPIEGASLEQARLSASRSLPEIRDWHGSAVRLLAGKTLAWAREAVKQAGAR